MANDDTLNNLEQQAYANTPSLDQLEKEAYADTPSPFANTQPGVIEQPKADPQASSEVNVYAPDGGLYAIPHDYLSRALEEGYQVATPELEARKGKEEKYGTAEEQLKTFGEGAASAATFGLSTGIEKALGVEDADIQGRREVNPGVRSLGEVTGLIGSTVVPFGSGAAAAKLGTMGAKALGFAQEAAKVGEVAKELSTAAKIGSAAVQGFVDNVLLQSSDEVSKLISNDPVQAEEGVSAALAHVGLAGAIGGVAGGAFGSLGPLWKATVGNKVGGLLSTAAKKAGGIEGVVSNDISEAVEKSGIELAPEIKAAITGNPNIKRAFQELRESSHKSGVEVNAAIKDFQAQLAEQSIKALGKTPEEVNALGSMSHYELGEVVKKDLVDELKTKIDPLSSKFERVKERFKTTELTDAVKSQLSEDISRVADKEGYLLSPSSESAKTVGNTLKELSGLRTLEDLRKYQSVLGQNTAKPELYRVGSQLKRVLRDTEEEVLSKALGERAPELLEEHSLARSGYKNIMDSLDNLSSRIKVGKYYGPDSFLRGLKDMGAEDLIKQISNKGDVEFSKLLQEQFPKTFDKVRDFQLSSILKNAAKKAPGGELISTKALQDGISALSPELKAALISPEAQVQLDAIKKLSDALPGRLNSSGTATTLGSMLKDTIPSAMGLVTGLLSHNPAAAYLVHGLVKLTQGTPDAVRLALLKFIGTGKAVEPAAFSATVRMIDSTIKGENAINRASKNLFREEAGMLPHSMLPKESDRLKLTKSLDKLRTNPELLMNNVSDLGHYADSHAQATGKITGNAVEYLNKLKPQGDRVAPLDSKPTINPVAKANYDKVLDIANQPLVILNKIKDGTATQGEVDAIKIMYPSLYNRLSNKLMSSITEATQKGVSIPYKTRLGLSLFLGQALDSTMTPQGISTSQLSQQLPAKLNDEQQQMNGMPKQGPKHSMNALNKLPANYMTPGQSAEQSRTKK